MASNWQPKKYLEIPAAAEVLPNFLMSIKFCNHAEHPPNRPCMRVNINSTIFVLRRKYEGYFFGFSKVGERTGACTSYKPNLKMLIFMCFVYRTTEESFSYF